MGFTVLRLDENDVTARWAVLLGNEHVMFVGTYRQCEEWLDIHEFVETDFHGHPEVPTRGGATCFGRIRSLLHAIAQRCPLLLACQLDSETALKNDLSLPNQASVHRRLRQAVVSFLKGDAGSGGMVEIVTAAILIASLYLGAILLSVTIACDRAVLYSKMLGMPSAARPLTAEASRNGSRNPGDSLEIACDLATSNFRSTDD